MGILDEVTQNVNKMDENALRAKLAEIERDKALRKEKMKARNANLTDEQKAERNLKSKEYREKNADKFKEKRNEYNKRPEVVERRKTYMQKRNAERKAILARAKELGITASA